MQYTTIYINKKISIKNFFHSNFLLNSVSIKTKVELELKVFGKKALKTDRQSLNLMFKSYSCAMYNICLRFTGNVQDAEDNLQEAFIHAFKNIHQLKHHNLFGAWLKRIVINQCIRFQKTRIQWISIEEKNDYHETVENYNWLNQLTPDVINNEIKALPDGCRMIFSLYVLEGYKHKEIASSLGISESTSKSQYIRAKKLLKEQLKKHIENDQV